VGKRIIINLNGPEATRDLGRRLGQLLRGGEVVALRGELGAGKTTLVQGLALGLGLEQESVTSPSFVLIANLIGGRLELKHVDLYRLNAEEAVELGLEELMTGPGSETGVTALEWAERAEEMLPSDRFEINLSWLGPHKRRAEIRALGPWTRKVLSEFEAVETKKTTRG